MISMVYQYLLLLSLGVQLVAGKYSYTLETTVSGDTHSGTDNLVEARLHGDAGRTGFAALDKSWVNDFQTGSYEIYTVESVVNIGKPLCAEFRIDGYDYLLLFSTRLVNQKLPNIRMAAFNWDRVKLSRDYTEGKSSLKLCQNECSKLLPLHESKWLHNGTVYDLDSAEVTTEDSTTIDFQIQDATDSAVDVSRVYHVGSTMKERLSFKKTGGPAGSMISKELAFTARPVVVKETTGEIGVDGDRQHYFTFRDTVEVMESLRKTFQCIAPAGTKIRCYVKKMKKRLVVPFTQTWQHKDKESCQWQITGQFIREWDDDLVQNTI